ncbi:tetratricopeptide repeat protein [Gandjariella thermophila]|uniref:Tetratrico peptide repeat group 5 domain-containing protein n=1 Tax=Gandjariella thermophila TaxID=1931992 RepID=A0A4D4JGT6_9PSEU|nr:tetratricopeptide repeat protein [Gandjariella thermophila]GDY33616.1 hypothetical protein GTS_52490 [Gandjariella thermophila]
MNSRAPKPAEDAERRPAAPELPDDIEAAALDHEIRSELRSLPKPVADSVARHLVAAGVLVDTDPERALEHARYARGKASRVAAVREANGLVAYHAGEWSEALAELRAARRMGGGPGHLAVMADCERALGRPERAIEIAREARGEPLPPAEAVELRIVAAGARRDMGQRDAAVVALQGPDLDPRRRDPWSARLFYAYADNLLEAGRWEEALRWFLNAAEADEEGETDAADRAFELAPDTEALVEVAGTGLPAAAAGEPADAHPAAEAPEDTGETTPAQAARGAAPTTEGSTGAGPGASGDTAAGTVEGDAETAEPAGDRAEERTSGRAEREAGER